MKDYLNRREFLANSALTATGLTLGLNQTSCQKDSRVKTSGKRTLKKAVILDKPTEESLNLVKQAGFHGIEAGLATPAKAEKIRAIAENLDLRIHSVLRGWAAFNSFKSEEVENTLVTTVSALQTAHAYGADVILLVPGRIGGMALPEAWDFRIQFDKNSGHLTAVTEKDNDRYADYIAAHNHAYDTFQIALHKLIPTAKQYGVVIAVENVWNNLFVDPLHMAHFIDSFQSKWVQAYFDIGNHVKYSPPEKWIGILNRRIVKCHVKDYKLNPDGRGGKFVPIHGGGLDWPVVIKALDNIGYNGWMTIEGSEELTLAQRSERLDLIIAGS